MGKIIVTQEQAEAMNSCKKDDGDKGEAIRHHINTWCAPPNRCLNELSLDELTEALYVGYEVEEHFKVGDFIIDKNDSYKKVIKITEIKTFHLFGNLSDRQGQEKGFSILRPYARYATESEIAAYRGCNYLKKQHYNKMVHLQKEKQLVEEECERYKKMFSKEKGKSITLYIKNKRYKQALEFYENEGNYKTVIDNDREIKFLGTSLAQMDGGEVARKVLESSGNEGKSE